MIYIPNNNSMTVLICKVAILIHLCYNNIMDELRHNLLKQRSQDRLMTKRQRRRIHELLRDGYDDAASDAHGDAFSVSLHLNDFSPLTPQNERYINDGHAEEDMQRLFGVIAARAHFSIDTHDNLGRIISLSREGSPNSSVDPSNS